MKDHSAGKIVVVLLGLTLLAILVHGYHPGAEDDGVYLPAIKHDLNPTLYPHDSDFFTLQLQATVFDKLVAGTIQLSHLPVAAVVLGWHFLVIFLILWGCLRIACHCFPEWSARWAAVSTVAALFTLPVAGTALYLVDQNLHPRALATAAILGAITAALERRFWLVTIFLAVACAVHPIMASFGISYCVFLLWKPAHLSESSFAAAAFVFTLPLSWIFEPTSPAWQQAAHTRDYFYLSAWHWYEWIGVFAPLFLLWWFSRLARRGNLSTLSHLSSRLLLYGIFQLAVALIIDLPSQFDRLKPFQPMRYLHLLYLLMFLFAGGLIGQRFLRTSWVRWAALFVPLCAGMYLAQRATFPASNHIDWPGATPRNQWLQAFLWVRQNTPQDSLFALGPDYMELPGEDAYSFRAWAERSVLADIGKDASVATQVPRLAPRWLQEVQAQTGWDHFQKADFENLHSRLGVNWVIVERAHDPELPCPYENAIVKVCKVD
jgi:hypothetical protein